jgi:hypothetical protein
MYKLNRIKTPMNKTRIISSILTIIFVILLIPVNRVMSQDGEERQKTPPEKECEEKKPKSLEKTKTGIDDFQSIIELETSINKGEIIFNYTKFQEVMDTSKDEYHTYAECIFNYSEKRILGNVGLSQGTVQANTPNIDWMDPKASCLSLDKLRGIMDDTAPNQLLLPLLDTNAAYSEYLDALVTLYQMQGREGGSDDTAIDAFLAAAQKYTNINLLVDMEKEVSLVVMNMAFIELKELRSSFVMHVQFQCMLNNLEKYRKWLGDIRTIVEGLPTKLEDASISK